MANVLDLTLRLDTALFHKGLNTVLENSERAARHIEKTMAGVFSGVKMPGFGSVQMPDMGVSVQAAQSFNVYKQMTGKTTEEIIKMVFALDKLEAEYRQMGAGSADAEEEINSIRAKLTAMIGDVRKAGNTWRELFDTLKSADFAKYIDFNAIEKNFLRSQEQIEDTSIRTNKRIVDELKKSLETSTKNISDTMRMQLMKQSDQFEKFMRQRAGEEIKVQDRRVKSKAQERLAEERLQKAIYQTEKARVQYEDTAERSARRAIEAQENYFQRFFRLLRETKETGFAYRPMQQMLAQFNQFSRAVSFFTEYWLRKLIDGIRYFTGVGLEFTRAMSEMKAAMIGESDFAGLEGFIREMAKQMPQTATEIAKAGVEMAKMGDTGLAIRQKLQSVIMLSQDFGSTEKAALNLNAALLNFNLTNEDASRVSDVFATVMDKSAANATHLSNGLKALKGITAIVKTDIEEFGAAIMLTSDRGLTGNVAMRGLRESLSRLSRAPKEVRNALASLNVQFDDINPATKSLTEILKTLNEAGAAEQDQIANLNRLFGQHAGTMSILIRNYEKFAENVDYLKSDSVLGRLAARFGILTDNLASDLKQFESQTEEFRLKVFKSIEQGLRDLVQAGTSLMAFLTDSGTVTRTATAVFASFAKTAEDVAIALEKNPIALERTVQMMGKVATAGVAVTGVFAQFSSGLMDSITYMGAAVLAGYALINTMNLVNAAMAININPVIAAAVALGGVTIAVSKLAEAWHLAKMEKADYFLKGDNPTEMLKIRLEEMRAMQEITADFEKKSGQGSALDYISNRLLEMSRTNLKLGLDENQIKAVYLGTKSTAEKLAEMRSILQGVIDQETLYLHATVNRNEALKSGSALIRQYRNEFEKTFVATKQGTEGEIERLQGLLNFYTTKLNDSDLTDAGRADLKTEILNVSAALENATETATAAADAQKAYNDALKQAQDLLKSFDESLKTDAQKQAEYIQSLRDAVNLSISDPAKRTAEIDRINRYEMTQFRANLRQKETALSNFGLNRLNGQRQAGQPQFIPTPDNLPQLPDIIAGIDALNLKWQQADAGFQFFVSNASNLLSNATSQWVSNISSFADFTKLRFKDLFGSIKSMFVQMLAQMAAKAAVFGLLNLLIPGAGSFLGGASKFIFGMATGGLIPEGERVIRVNEQGQEYISDAQTTARFLPFLQALPNMQSIQGIPAPFIVPAPPSIETRMVANSNTGFSPEMIGELRNLRTEMIGVQRRIEAMNLNLVSKDLSVHVQVDPLDEVKLYRKARNGKRALKGNPGLDL